MADHFPDATKKIDFISREAAAEQLRSYKIERDLMVSHNDTIDFAISVISAEVPAADVRPVVRGRWIRGRESMTSPGKDSYICSVCGEKTLSGFCGNPAKTNFCPNCGADMREVKTDD